MAEEQQNRWIDRNDVVKTFKLTGDFGWMHLVIGKNKVSGRRFMRLKRYMNWFSIPDSAYLGRLQGMLKKGAQELGWEYGETEGIDITEVKDRDTEDVSVNISDEAIDLIEKCPNLIEEIVNLKLDKNDIRFVLELVRCIDATLLKSSERYNIAFREVLGKLSTQDAKGMQELSDLMDELNLIQITSLTNIIKHRLETIETFETMIHDPKTYEISTDKSIHRLLEKSMWIIDDNYWIVQSNKSLRTFIGDEVLKGHKGKEKKRPDFACSEHGGKLIILEIKKPSIELKKEELDQIEFYLRVIHRYKSANFTSIGGYLIGNKISDEARETVEFRKGIKIKTYNDFLSDCRRRYQSYLRIIDDEK